MAVTLRWVNRVLADEIRVYRDVSPMDPFALPPPLDTLAGSALTYVDSSVVGGTTYFYRVGAVLTSVSPDKIVVSEEVQITASDVPSLSSPSSPSEVPIPPQSYTGAVVTLTATDNVEGQALPWDAVSETGATGFWDGANPERLVVPTGASLVQITAQARFAPASAFAGGTFIVLLKNGATFSPQPAAGKRQTSSSAYSDVTLVIASGPIVVVPGDYFALFWNCSVAASAILSDDATWMEMEVLA